jgi:hypothetical protein
MPQTSWIELTGIAAMGMIFPGLSLTRMQAWSQTANFFSSRNSEAHRGRVGVVSAEGQFVLLSADVWNSLLSFRASHRIVQSTGNDHIFQLAIVGPAGISARREALIGSEKRFECAVDFEFLDIESDD